MNWLQPVSKLVLNKYETVTRHKLVFEKEIKEIFGKHYSKFNKEILYNVDYR